MALVALVEAYDHARHPLEGARAGQRPGVEGAAGYDLRREVERERLRVRVVAADEGVLVGTAVGELAGGEGVEACNHGGAKEILRPLGERERVGRAQIAGHAEHGGLSDRLRQVGCGGERPGGVRREHDEIRAAHRLFVRSPGGRADLARLVLRAFGVAGADHALVARLDQSPGEREPEISRAADDRDLHAGTAPNAASATRRRASSSLMNVRVTIGRTSPRPSRSSASASSTTSASISPS